VNLNSRRHWKFRTSRATAAFDAIRRLTRLPPQAKRKVAIGQILPMLTYGSELHCQPSEEGSRFAARVGRWVVMGYGGSSRGKISDLSGIDALKEITRRKRIRCAASVYARNEEELRPRAERILREEL